jgi:hypothetical protein
MSFQCQQSQQNITNNQKFDSQYDSGNVQGPSENGQKQDLMCENVHGNNECAKMTIDWMFFQI